MYQMTFRKLLRGPSIYLQGCPCPVVEPPPRPPTLCSRCCCRAGLFHRLTPRSIAGGPDAQQDLLPPRSLFAAPAPEAEPELAAAAAEQEASLYGDAKAMEVRQQHIKERQAFLL